MSDTERKLAVTVKEYRADVDNPVRGRVFTWEKEKHSETETSKSGSQKERNFNVTWDAGVPCQCSFRIECQI